MKYELTIYSGLQPDDDSWRDYFTQFLVDITQTVKWEKLTINKSGIVFTIENQPLLLEAVNELTSNDSYFGYNFGVDTL